MSTTGDRPIGRLAAARLDSVDLLRGFACLSVTYTHAFSSWGSEAAGHGPWRLVTWVLGAGGLGVDLFVGISGFCLFYPVLQRAARGAPQHSIAAFYRRRLSRICPVYCSAIVFALAILGAGFHIADFRGVADVVPHALFVQNLMPDYVGRIDGPLWSVALEMQLYLCFPLFAWALLRFHWAWLAVATALLSVAASLVHAAGWFDRHPVDLSDAHGVPARAVEFVFGMIAASLCATGNRPPRRALYVAAPFAFAVGVFVSGRSQQANPIRHLQLPLFAVVTAAILIALIDFDRRRPHLLHRLTPLRLTGLISFSLYVVHFPVMLAMQSRMAPHIHGPIQAVALYTVTGLPLTLLVAVVMFLVVERYTLNVGVPAGRHARRGSSAAEAGAGVPSDTDMLAAAGR